MTDKELRARLARNVRARRAAHGMTLETAANAAGIHVRHWQRIEAGDLNATVRTIVKIASALDVDPVVLLTKSTEEK